MDVMYEAEVPGWMIHEEGDFEGETGAEGNLM